MPFQQATGADKKHQDRLRLEGRIPEHIAIIMDGNGRWAKKRSFPRAAGHKEGVNSVRDIVEACGQLGLRYLTLYTFSTENWKRPQNEVSMLMRLIVHALRNERDRMHKNDVRLMTIGDLSALPEDVARELVDAVESMRHNKGLALILALNYSGRWDILEAVKKIDCEISAGHIKKNDLTEEVFKDFLSTKGIPDPDLVIRTSGEYRISNFLLWQVAYSEMYIADELWPSFRRKQLYEAIADYQRRERRFGMVSEQLTSAAEFHKAF